MTWTEIVLWVLLLGCAAFFGLIYLGVVIRCIVWNVRKGWLEAEFDMMREASREADSIEQAIKEEIDRHGNVRVVFLRKSENGDQ